MGNPYKWLGWKREREVYKICKKHFDKLLEIVEKLNVFLAKFKEADEEYREIFQDIFNLEREADTIKEEIISELTGGVIHPIDREDIMRLIYSADDVASYAKAAARKLVYVDPSVVPNEILDNLVKIGEMSLDEMRHLKNALDYLMKDAKKAMEETNKVERIEESIDEFREEMISQILRWADKVDFISHWLMMKEAVENIEMMSDSMEDTGDIIRGLAVTG